MGTGSSQREYPDWVGSSWSQGPGPFPCPCQPGLQVVKDTCGAGRYTGGGRNGGRVVRSRGTAAEVMEGARAEAAQHA